MKNSSWTSLSPLLELGLGALVVLAAAGLLYVVVTLVLIALGDLGIGESCRPSC